MCDCDKRPVSLQIMRLRDGGFIVGDTHSKDLLRADLYACSTIDEALAYIKQQIGNVKTTEAA